MCALDEHFHDGHLLPHSCRHVSAQGPMQGTSVEQTAPQRLRRQVVGREDLFSLVDDRKVAFSASSWSGCGWLVDELPVERMSLANNASALKLRGSKGSQAVGLLDRKSVV